MASGGFARFVLVLLLLLPATVDAEVQSVRTLIDVRSNHSDGGHDFETLIRLAKGRGIEALAFTEHDRTAIRLGIEPIPSLLGYTMERPSLYTTGLDNFFADLAAARNRHPEIVLLAGVEATPGYAWRGTPLLDLTLVDAERHLIALGAEKREQIETLPSYRLAHLRMPLSLWLGFWIVLTLLLLLFARHRRWQLSLAVVSLAMGGWAMVRAMQPAPDADAAFIAQAGKNGLLTLWTHPSTRSGVRAGPLGVQLDTPPYSNRIFMPPFAAGFSALYGDTEQSAEPNGPWDRHMLDRLHGSPLPPLWAFAAGDFHAEGEAGEFLGNFPMDLFVAAKGERPTPQELLAALRGGRMVAWGLPKDRNLSFAELWLQDDSGYRLLPGDDGMLSGTLHLHAQLTEFGAAAAQWPDALDLIVDGELRSRIAPGSDGLIDESLLLSPGPHLIRLRMPPQKGVRMESNPFMPTVAAL